MIPFNKPFLTGRESQLIEEAMSLGRLAGNGEFTKKCHEKLSADYGLDNCFLTSSATSALEMSALLVDLQPGDEVIIPSFTFVSTATPFALRGAKLIFADSRNEHPNVAVAELKRLISDKTKIIVVMHYAGMACEMDEIMELANQKGIVVIEDAAHCIGSNYKDRPLGTIGHLAAFSFHETKNISSGQGGLLVVNDKKFLDRADMIWDRGTNRKAFNQGKVSSYSWHDHGSNFYPSEITAAFLLAQLEERTFIEESRKRIWNFYAERLKSLANIGYQLPKLEEYQSNNHHIFYLICPSKEKRDGLIAHLRQQDILAVFHYLPLHSSAFMQSKEEEIADLPNADFFSDHLVRLPLFVELKEEELEKVVEAVLSFS
ncbi:MAG: dTDP-4-amino-4,6-dideoxygalactose transaminase [Crocinitomicaceae bacterium]|nr:dTDP-4-amino-4,6-dideoxygalactose transaminase [Crocinitomicaceae bacterium]